MKHDKIKDYIVQKVFSSRNKLTPPILEKSITHEFSIPKKDARILIRELIENKKLTYTQEYGCTFIETSFNRPVRISKHVVLSPPNHPFQRKNEDVIIRINQGTSFGSGQHPTTRLAARGIEFVLTEKKLLPVEPKEENRLLDIGTGSGILAIIGVKLGISGGIGIDLDPCAISEAKENVKLNGLINKIVIENRPVEALDGSFSMVTANLRIPTLIRFSDLFFQLLHKNGVIVISGIQSGELCEFKEIYMTKGFQYQWAQRENGWAGVVFNKISQ